MRKDVDNSLPAATMPSNAIFRIPVAARGGGQVDSTANPRTGASIEESAPRNVQAITGAVVGIGGGADRPAANLGQGVSARGPVWSPPYHGRLDAPRASVVSGWGALRGYSVSIGGARPAPPVTSSGPVR